MSIDSPDFIALSDRNYQILLEAIPDLMLRLSREGVCLDFRLPRSFRACGAEIAWQGKFLWEFMPPDLAHLRMQYVERAIVTNEVQMYEQELDFDGEVQYEEVRVIRCNDQEALVIIRDISDRKYAEHALRQSESRFQKLAANVPGMLYQFRLTPDGIASFPFVSAFAQELWELEPQVIYENGNLPSDQVHPDDRESFEASIRNSAETLQPWSWIGRIITPSGRLKWIQAQSRPELQTDGATLWDGLLVDVSDRKANEEALRQSETRLRQQAIELEIALQELQRTQAQLIHTEKMSSLGQLVAGIAHEINNPISFIYGNLTHASTYIADITALLDLYQKHYPDPHSEVQQLIEDMDLDFVFKDLTNLFESMRTGAERIREIVLSLRTFSRLDEAECKTVSIQDGIESTLTILQNRLNQRETIKLVKHYAQIPEIECFAGSLNQVFLQIITNAIDSLEFAMKDNQWLANCWIGGQQQPMIQLYTEQLDSQWIRIRIVDNGVGMSEAVQARMFDPFFTTKPIGKGTGMGLATSYQIVIEQHKGRLTCRSAPRRGAEFAIDLPIRQGSEKVVSHPSQ
ncbi:PAS domain-containing sensor histidine kinase [Leptolyngbya sp. NIES-2104]|uniref:PAS domain-containing sensor histidine kinase n=1 Tax=Leptolyngbya sp. NIES-2104 TaxID=1552121 RepID=UPI0006ECA01B|nr:ATP-binding protein [Leptolyngbya sp. NIES-2104]GAP94863.1 circadian input kinase A [Leptolyngbya sp. NIES-2104]